MNDRELLELAAKAAGYPEEWHGEIKVETYDKPRLWNPLTDDGDALRLAVKLGLTVTPNYHVEQASIGVIAFTEIEDTADYCAPTRRAIVRAAAEIGRVM